MALHELTTNALKYGALSADVGQVNLEWRADGPNRIVIEWIENGGPAVSAPVRRGFGSDLIERGLARQFGGTASLQFSEEGLRCVITVPVSRHKEQAA